MKLLSKIWPPHFDGLVQERRDSIANALELRLSCTKPSIYHQYPRELLWKSAFPEETLWEFLHFYSISEIEERLD